MPDVLRCRVCQNTNLQEVINLGNQPLSGVFPQDSKEFISSGELKLMRCPDCGLVQLGSSFPSKEMYGENYGYRSGLNSTMVDHLQRIAKGLIRKIDLVPGDVVCDIGSNDGTFLMNFEGQQLDLIGIDPTAAKYRAHYAPGVTVVSDFFSEDVYFTNLNRKAKVVTSIAMFYDLDDPVEFASQVNNILSEDGYWLIEMSYAPWMQSSGAYDTICHEHLEYYSLADLARILNLAGFYVRDVSTNAINGGSITVLARKLSKALSDPSSEYFNWLTAEELRSQVNTLESWMLFAHRVESRRDSLRNLVNEIVFAGKTLYGLGASTKGNVLLNYSGLDNSLISAIGEVNPDKYGRVTPGSNIPIVPEDHILKMNPDYLLFLPWHFRENAIQRYEPYLTSGGRFIFPLPSVEVLGY
jgi:hypothetical protein